MVVEDSKGECNLGQHEINFHYADALRTADEHVIYKNGAKEIAAEMGMAITFMAKFNEREGNSCHIHFSLADEEGPLFARDRGTFDAFLAGQLAALRELTLLLAPNINSYKRYAAGSFAPTAIAWGHDNRTCALRVVGHGHVAALREPRRWRRPQSLPRALSAHRRRSARRRARPRARAGLRGRRLQRAAPAAPAHVAGAGARAVRGLSARARGLRRGGRRALPQRRRRRARGLRKGGHRLGAVPRLRAPVSVAPADSEDAVFAPVRSQTAFEETVERLGTAIKLGLLAPGHAAAGRARAVPQARDRALDAAPGAARARPDRAPAGDARPPRRDVRRRTRSRRPSARRTSC